MVQQVKATVRRKIALEVWNSDNTAAYWLSCCIYLVTSPSWCARKINKITYIFTTDNLTSSHAFCLITTKMCSFYLRKTLDEQRRFHFGNLCRWRFMFTEKVVVDYILIHHINDLTIAKTIRTSGGVVRSNCGLILFGINCEDCISRYQQL